MSSNNSHVQFSDVRTFHTTPTYYNSLYNPNNFPVVPPNELYHYNIKCNEISYSNVIFLLNKSLNSKEFNTQSNENEYIFFYQQEYHNRFYQVTCEIVSPSSITNYLNENIYGIKPQQEQQEERLSFIIEQKQNLEFHLTQYLRNYLLN
ncbi:hypothetical protein RhiirC2_774716 [Rhizophagus irregularis]|uniref:Uncharacterized protein n=1 Tax=Rhizophagus irregularis TaxID=588596 RepID=A0A2N1NKX0_9GLOM|nr:hypothetical protein RhiirC2_774716 [Rhizophagus irregularis]